MFFEICLLYRHGKSAITYIEKAVNVTDSFWTWWWAEKSILLLWFELHYSQLLVTWGQTCVTWH